MEPGTRNEPGDEGKPEGKPDAKAIVRVLGRYCCTDQIGARPPLVTYRARTQGLAGFERAFAVKCFLGEGTAYPADADRAFLDAGRRLATLRDPRLAQVIEVGQADGVPFVVTEMVLGTDLTGVRDLARRTAAGEDSGLPSTWPALVAHVGAEVALALAVGHAQSPAWPHGDLGPTNVVLSHRGAVKVLDHGLRAALPPPRRRPGARPTLPPYLAPELLQADGVSPAADVYALGALLFELGTGRVPPSATQPKPATDITRALGSLGDKLARAIARLLTSDPSARPTAQEAAALLRATVDALSDTETRGHLGGVVRRATLPPGGVSVGSSSESLLVPKLLAPTPPPPPEPRARLAHASSAPPRTPPSAEESTAPAIPRRKVEALASSAQTPTARGKTSTGPSPLKAKTPTPAPAPRPRRTTTALGAKPAERPRKVTLGSILAASRKPPPRPIPQDGAPRREVVDVSVAHDSGRMVAVRSSTAAPPPSPIDSIFPLSSSELEMVVSSDELPEIFPPAPPSNAEEPTTTDAVALATGDLDLMSLGDAIRPVALPPPVPAPRVAGAMPEELPPDLTDLTTGELDLAFASGRKPPTGEGPAFVPDPAAPVSVVPASADFTGGQATVAEDAGATTEDVPALESEPVSAEMDALLDEQPSEPTHADPPPVTVAFHDLEAAAGARAVVAGASARGRAGSRKAVVLIAGAAVVTAMGGAAFIAFMRKNATVPSTPSIATTSGTTAHDEKAPRASEPAPNAPSEAKPTATPTPSPAPGPGVATKEKNSATATTPPTLKAPPTAPAPTPAPTIATSTLIEKNTTPPKQAEVTASAATPTTADDLSARAHEKVAFVTTPSGAAVWINAALRGHTPTSISLHGKPVRITIVRPGFETVQDTLDPASAGARWERALVPTSAARWGKANLTIECATADRYPISVDGDEIGLLCPAENVGLVPGPHEVSIFVPWRNKSYPVKVTLRNGATKVVKYPK